MTARDYLAFENFMQNDNSYIKNTDICESKEIMSFIAEVFRIHDEFLDNKNPSKEETLTYLHELLDLSDNYLSKGSKFYTDIQAEISFLKGKRNNKADFSNDLLKLRAAADLFGTKL